MNVETKYAYSVLLSRRQMTIFNGCGREALVKRMQAIILTYTLERCDGVFDVELVPEVMRAQCILHPAFTFSKKL